MEMASFVFAALALCLFAQPGLSKPEQAASSNIEQLVKEFQTSIDKSIADAKKNLNLPDKPDGAAIVKALREQSDKAEKSFKDLKTKLDETIKKNPDISNAINNLKAKLEEGENKLKKDNPEFHANAKKVVDTFQSVYDSLGKEMEKINAEVNKKGGIREDLDNLLKKLIDDGIAIVKDVETKVKEGTKKA